MTRWTVLVTALAIATVGSTAVAVQAERASAASTSAVAAGTSSVQSPITPVLSARRVPELIAAPVADRRLVTHLNDLMSRTPATSCLTVAVSGRTVFSSNPTVPLAPASIEKLVTEEAALSRSGPSAVFTPQLVTNDPPENHVDHRDVRFAR